MADENTVFGYDDQKVTHQPRVIFDYTSGRRTQLAWDANGNLALLWECEKDFTRFHDWDDENRLRMVVGNNRAGYYGYDANGERVYKLTGTSTITHTSDEVSDAVVYLDSAVLYPNPYVTIAGNGYTKHYYANGERLATSMGSGGWCYMSSDVITQTQTDHEDDLQNHFIDICQSEYPFEYPQEPLSKLTPNVDIDDLGLDKLQYMCPVRRLRQLRIESGYDMLLEAMHRFCDAHGGEEDETFYTHGDHLGSANWITDYKGYPIQYLHYLPYGQLLANQQATSTYDERFKFTGKERDAETGYDYFGARYYMPLLYHWTKVDPLVDDYLHISPYAYCNWNPVKYVDPDGRYFDDANEVTAQKIEAECQNKLSSKPLNLFRRKELNKTLQDIADMRNDGKNEYRFELDKNKPGTTGKEEKDGHQVITMYSNLETLDETVAHEGMAARSPVEKCPMTIWEIHKNMEYGKKWMHIERNGDGWEVHWEFL